jgi:hypothetical protein
MGFRIELGIPEMRDFFEDLLKRLSFCYESV